MSSPASYAALAASIGASNADGVLLGAAPNPGADALLQELHAKLPKLKLFAAMMGVRLRPLLSEELTLRARADLESGRHALAALDLRQALEPDPEVRIAASVAALIDFQKSEIALALPRYAYARDIVRHAGGKVHIDDGIFGHAGGNHLAQDRRSEFQRRVP